MVEITRYSCPKCSMGYVTVDSSFDTPTCTKCNTVWLSKKDFMSEHGLYMRIHRDYGNDELKKDLESLVLVARKEEWVKIVDQLALGRKILITERNTSDNDDTRERLALEIRSVESLTSWAKINLEKIGKDLEEHSGGDT